MEMSVWLTYIVYLITLMSLGHFVSLEHIWMRPGMQLSFRLREVWASAHGTCRRKQNQIKSNCRWYWYRFLVDEPTNEDLVCIVSVCVCVCSAHLHLLTENIPPGKRNSERMGIKNTHTHTRDDSQIGVYVVVSDRDRRCVFILLYEHV